MDKKKSNFGQIEVGQYLSETQYYKVLGKSHAGLEVENERGFTFNVGKNIVEEGMYSAIQSLEEEKVTRTELIKLFSEVGDTVFTVCFMKQPKAKDVNEALASINKGKILSNAAISKAVKNAYKGTERVLTGYIVSTETGFGRSSVIDLEVKREPGDWDNRQRQVDHRTLKWLVFKNKKFVVK